ncbi:MAG: DUF4112 domain-containing protein [Verrucomicrobiota bacterium]
MSESPQSSHLPPGSPAPQGSGSDPQPEQASGSTRAIAKIMDEAISIPGTKIKFGLDPILGIINPIVPVGDITTNTVSLVSLLEAVRRGMPLIYLWKIVGNIFLNAGFGSIPIIGDMFSFIFRSNSRNRDLIDQYLAEAVASGKKPSWWRVVAGVFLVILVAICAFALSFGIWLFVGQRIIKYLMEFLSQQGAA